MQAGLDKSSSPQILLILNRSCDLYFHFHLIHFWFDQVYFQAIAHFCQVLTNFPILFHLLLSLKKYPFRLRDKPDASCQ